jgi:hypothetical protein
MITGITVPANNRLQRTVMDKVPRHKRRRAAAEPERYASSRAERSY